MGGPHRMYVGVIPRLLVLMATVVATLVWSGSALATHAPPGTKLWGYEASLAAARILQYDIGTDTFDTSCVPPGSQNGRGLAFDPRSGGFLWYTFVTASFQGDGFIHKTSLPPGCTNMGQIPIEEGPGPPTFDDVGAMDIDPDNGNLYIAEYISGLLGKDPVSTLAEIDEGSGNIIRACNLPPADDFGNDSLAVVKNYPGLPPGKHLVTDNGEFMTTQQFVIPVTSMGPFTPPASAPPCQIVATGNTPGGRTGYDFLEPSLGYDMIATNLSQIFDHNGFPWSSTQAAMSAAPSTTLEDVTLRAQVGPGEPAEIILTESPDHQPVNEVGTEHCVTATVLDDQGQPVPGVTVSFDVEGSSDEPVPFGDAEGSANTGPDGMAEFCYTGPDLPGQDTIIAFIDEDSDQTRDLNELQSNPLVKTWILPTTTPGCEINISNGGWITTSTGSRGSFGGNAKAEVDGTTKGSEEYQDHGLVPVNIHSVEILRVVCDGETRAEIYGTATVNGLQPPVDFRIVVQDLGEPGSKTAPRDTYQIITGAYASGPENNPLLGGNVQIHRFS